MVGPTTVGPTTVGPTTGSPSALGHNRAGARQDRRRRHVQPDPEHDGLAGQLGQDARELAQPGLPVAADGDDVVRPLQAHVQAGLPRMPAATATPVSSGSQLRAAGGTAGRSGAEERERGPGLGVRAGRAAAARVLSARRRARPPAASPRGGGGEAASWDRLGHRDTRDQSLLPVARCRDAPRPAVRSGSPRVGRRPPRAAAPYRLCEEIALGKFLRSHIAQLQKRGQDAA